MMKVWQEVKIWRKGGLCTYGNVSVRKHDYYLRKDGVCYERHDRKQNADG